MKATSHKIYRQWGQNSTQIPMAATRIFANLAGGVYNFEVTGANSKDAYAAAPTETLYDQRIDEILDRVKGLEKMIQGLVVNECEPETDQGEIRDVPYEQAKREAEAYFKAHHGKHVDASDLQDTLGIEIWTALQICEELQQEGKIAEI